MSCELDLNIMRILINVYVRSQTGNLTHQVLTGLLQALGNIHSALCSVPSSSLTKVTSCGGNHSKENLQCRQVSFNETHISTNGYKQIFLGSLLGFPA